MTYSSSLGKNELRLVLDASVLINLLATGHATDVLRAVATPIVVPEAVVREVRDGEARGHGRPTLLEHVLQLDGFRVAALDDDSSEVFAALVSGSTPESLGDGEAATIAAAVTSGGIAVIDEKKAIGICAKRYPGLSLATTVDILSHRAVLTAIGTSALRDAVLKALVDARMQVRDHQFPWVADLIGSEGVAQCSSLARLARKMGVSTLAEAE